MKLSRSAKRRGPALIVLVVSAILAGCGTGSAPTVAPPTGADPGGPPSTTGPIVVDGDPSGAPATSTPIATSDSSVSGGVEVTPSPVSRYKYRISAGSPTRKPTIKPFGATQKFVADVGSSYLTLAVTIENLSPNESEELSDVVHTYPDVSYGGYELVPGGLFLATPASLLAQLPNLYCSRGLGDYAPQGTCAIFYTGVEWDPSNSLDPNSTEIPIGGSVTVTLVAGVSNNNAPWQGIPDKLPSGADLVLDSSNILLYFGGIESAATQVPIGPG